MVKKLSGLIFLFLFILTVCFQGNVLADDNSLTVSNDYFSFTMPKKTKGTYIAVNENNGIYILEKILKERDQGGFAFSILMYKNPDDYSDMEDAQKIGELIDKNNNIYDIVLYQPREIYYGDGRKIAKNYKRIYDFAQNVEIKGINGNKYIKN